MNVRQLARGLEGLGPKVGQPVDATGHTFAGTERCTRCGVGIPARRQYTATECAGRASSLEEYAARREAGDAPAGQTRVAR